MCVNVVTSQLNMCPQHLILAPYQLFDTSLRMVILAGSRYLQSVTSCKTGAANESYFKTTSHLLSPELANQGNLPTKVWYCPGQELIRIRCYLQALLQSHKLFEAGVLAIRHLEGKRYYDSLFSGKATGMEPSNPDAEAVFDEMEARCNVI